MKEVYLRIFHGENIALCGSWQPANNLIDNYKAQESLGWHIFFALNQGADKVEVVCGDQKMDYQGIKK